MPWSNLIGLYATTGKFNEGLNAYNEALKLNAKLQNIYVNYALLQEKQKNYLLAEQFYRKSIYLNSRHYLPFERLGFVYLNETNYALADSFFKEAALRKMGLHSTGDFDADGVLASLDANPPQPYCTLKTEMIGKKDAMGHFAWGKTVMNSNIAEAEKQFKIVISIDSLNPLAYHYLGQLYYRQHRWQEAEIVFRLAKRNYLSEKEFNRYLDSLAATSSKMFACVQQIFKESFYPKIDNYFFLGGVYEQWNHVDEAAIEYRSAITEAPNKASGYYKLWNLLETSGRYFDAENTIIEYSFKANEVSGQNELAAYYQRMIKRYPRVADWYYVCGSYLYGVAKKHPERFENDKKIILPDSHLEINTSISHEADLNENSTIPGTKEEILFSKTISQPRTDALAMLLIADSLLADESALGDASNKIAELYFEMGLNERAIPYLKKYASLQPSNASTRVKLVKNYLITYLLTEAKTELDSLYARKEINFEQQLLLAQMRIHLDQHESAKLLLKEAANNYPYPSSDIIGLEGRSEMLAGNYKSAITLYKQLISKHPSTATYTIARLYAKQGDKEQAFNWLNRSLAEGFNYALVVKKDPFFDALRSSTKWTTLIEKYNLTR